MKIKQPDFLSGCFFILSKNIYLAGFSLKVTMLTGNFQYDKIPKQE